MLPKIYRVKKLLLLKFFYAIIFLPSTSFNSMNLFKCNDYKLSHTPKNRNYIIPRIIHILSRSNSFSHLSQIIEIQTRYPDLRYIIIIIIIFFYNLRKKFPSIGQETQSLNASTSLLSFPTTYDACSRPFFPHRSRFILVTPDRNRNYYSKQLQIQRPRSRHNQSVKINLFRRYDWLACTIHDFNCQERLTDKLKLFDY